MPLWRGQILFFIQLLFDSHSEENKPKKRDIFVKLIDKSESKNDEEEEEDAWKKFILCQDLTSKRIVYI